jgi:hypothetical protein
MPLPGPIAGGKAIYPQQLELKPPQVMLAGGSS